MIPRGHLVPLDHVEALKWFRLAADQEMEPARFALGVMYQNGQGVPQDVVAAHMWFDLASAGGHSNAVAARDALASKMTPAQLAEATRLAHVATAVRRARRSGQDETDAPAVIDTTNTSEE